MALKRLSQAIASLSADRRRYICIFIAANHLPERCPFSCHVCGAMAQLILKRGSPSRRRAEDYDLLENGGVEGRIF
jgi:hypothetical protein